MSLLKFFRPDRLTNKRIWITGAGSGIGKSLALALAAAGNLVVISGRRQEALEAVWVRYPENIFTVACDITDDNAIDGVRESIKSAVGALDIAIFCAGSCEYVENLALETELFRRVFDVNVFGSVNSTSIALPLLHEANRLGGKARPQIVGVSSLSSIVGLPRAEAYGASKAAFSYFLESLRLDLTTKNIDVTLVNPGFVETPMTDVNDFPMPFLMDVQSAAKRIIDGISRRELRVDFPRRLYYTLSIARSFPWLWYRVVGPKLSRNQ